MQRISNYVLVKQISEIKIYRLHYFVPPEPK